LYGFSIFFFFSVKKFSSRFWEKQKRNRKKIIAFQFVCFFFFSSFCPELNIKNNTINIINKHSLKKKIALQLRLNWKCDSSLWIFKKNLKIFCLYIYIHTSFIANTFDYTSLNYCNQKHVKIFKSWKQNKKNLINNI
jgi:hypothetical protein